MSKSGFGLSLRPVLVRPWTRDVFIVALYVPWCRYLAEQHGVTPPPVGLQSRSQQQLEVPFDLPKSTYQSSVATELTFASCPPGNTLCSLSLTFPKSTEQSSLATEFTLRCRSCVWPCACGRVAMGVCVCVQQNWQEPARTGKNRQELAEAAEPPELAELGVLPFFLFLQLSLTFEKKKHDLTDRVFFFTSC